jgi:hypothetical protein
MRLAELGRVPFHVLIHKVGIAFLSGSNAQNPTEGANYSKWGKYSHILTLTRNLNWPKALEFLFPTENGLVFLWDSKLAKSLGLMRKYGMKSLTTSMLGSDLLLRLICDSQFNQLMNFRTESKLVL